MKLCVECQNFNGSACWRPTGRTSLVDGSPIMVYEGAEESRKSLFPVLLDSCGPQARFFVQRTSERLMPPPKTP